MGNVAYVLLQISWRIRQRKNFDNWPTTVKVMNKYLVAQFFTCG